MTASQRMKMRLFSLVSGNTDDDDEDDLDVTPISSDNSDMEKGIDGERFTFENEHIYERQQYTVISSKPTFLERLKGLNQEDFLYSPSTLFCQYINWTFKASFSTVFLSFLALFMFLIFIFGVLMMWVGESQPSW